MSLKILDKFHTYQKVYRFVGSGTKTRIELQEYLEAEMKDTTKVTVYKHVDKAFSGELPALKVNGDKISIDEAKLKELVVELLSLSGVDACKLFAEPEPKKKKPEDDIAKITTVESPRVQELKGKISELQVRLSQEQKKRKEELEQYEAERKKELDKIQKQLDRLKSRRAKKACEEILEEMDKKVVVMSSIHSVPPKPLDNDFFLDDSHWELDIPYMVSVYGGEKDSLYKVIDGDEKKLEVKPYVSNIFKRLLNGTIFKKRLEDESHLELIKQGTISEDKARYLERRKITGEQIYANRLASINRMLDNPNLTNQEKLAYYAAMTEMEGREMHDLLNYAGDNCIEAREIIRLLEDPMEFNNYNNVRGYLRQAAKPSEARIMRKTVRELISGEWYVEAEYNGEKCKFQMLPVGELEAFKKALLDSQFAEALVKLQKLIATERKATFVNNDEADVLVVIDVEEESVVDKLQEDMPDGVMLMRQAEDESGVDIHVVIENEFIEDDFEGVDENEGKE